MRCEELCLCRDTTALSITFVTLRLRGLRPDTLALCFSLFALFHSLCIYSQTAAAHSLHAKPQKRRTVSPAPTLHISLASGRLPASLYRLHSRQLATHHTITGLVYHPVPRCGRLRLYQVVSSVYLAEQ